MATTSTNAVAVLYQTLSNGTFWIAIGSLATATLAYLTYRSLRQYRQKEWEEEKRELTEKIIQPLIQSLNVLAYGNLPELQLTMPTWENMKRDNPYILFKLPEGIVKAMDEFVAELQNAFYLRDGTASGLLGIISDRVVGKIPHPPASYDSSYANHAHFRWSIKGKPFYFTFPRLIFENSSLAKEIEKSKKDAPAPTLDGATFQLAGQARSDVSPELFDQILADIRGVIDGNSDLVEFVEKLRDLQKKAIKIIAELESLKKP